MRRPALALAWLSRWLLLKQTLLPEPGWLAWQLARQPAWQLTRRPTWRQPVFSLLVLQLAWRLVLQPVWQRQVWLLVSLQQVLQQQVLQQQFWQPVWLQLLQLAWQQF
jgi:hypothetical protein